MLLNGPNSPNEASIEPWLFQVEPYPGESFGHVLGRFRRANHLSSPHLSSLLGLKPHVVSYWEAPSRRRVPSASELARLSELMGIDIEQLRLMLAATRRQLHLRTRLCGLCYAEAPFHRQSWQMANITDCDRHQCQLLSACPQCQTDFHLPAHWDMGQCEWCGLPFAQMGL